MRLFFKSPHLTAKEQLGHMEANKGCWSYAHIDLSQHNSIAQEKIRALINLFHSAFSKHDGNIFWFKPMNILITAQENPDVIKKILQEVLAIIYDTYHQKNLNQFKYDVANLEEHWTKFLDNYRRISISHIQSEAQQARDSKITIY